MNVNTFQKRRLEILKKNKLTFGKSYSSEEEAQAGLRGFVEKFPQHYAAEPKNFKLSMMPVPPPHIDAVYAGTNKQVIKDFQEHFNSNVKPIVAGWRKLSS